jgi:hypothetical protein
MSLALDLACALDPVIFAGERLGLTLDPLQSALLRARSRRSLLKCCRQWGKSTVTAVGALHEAEYLPGSRTIIVSPSQRQSSLLLSTVAGFADLAGIRTRPLQVENVSGLCMAGGEVIALPSAEATTRGFSRCTWLVVDEAARVLDAVYRSARAYLATTDGRISLLSTPFGQRGFYYVAHESGKFVVTEALARDCPRISPAFLAEEYETQPFLWCEQEGLFSHDLILASVDEDLQPLAL